jgi:hypothetical protein
MVLNQGLTWRLSKKSCVMLCVFSMYMVISWVSEPGKFWNDWSSLGSSFKEMTALRFSSRFRKQPSINLTLRGKTICQLRSSHTLAFYRLDCVHRTIGYKLSMQDSTNILQNLADFHMFLSRILTFCVPWLCFTSMSVSRNTKLRHH